ncbi:MAG: hypothetical protein KC912_07935 [Proteobacteria bacterium]|nr:hypothetical protein [Pseudomonadota bacterium]
MGQYVDVAFQLTRQAFEAKFTVTQERDEEFDEVAYDVGGLPVQFGADVVVVCTLWGPGVSVPFAVAEADKAVPGLGAELGPDRVAVGLEAGDVSDETGFAELTRGWVHGDGLSEEREVFTALFGEDLPSRAEAAPSPRPAPTEDVDAIAEAYLEGIDVRALRLAIEQKIRDRS